MCYVDCRHRNRSNTNTCSAADRVPGRRVAGITRGSRSSGSHTLGGVLRFQYVFEDFRRDRRQRGGDLEFDLFAVNADVDAGDLQLSTQYRWYAFQEVIHHGWIGWSPSDDLQLQAGITQVPFGLLPYASHSFWFGMP